MRKRRLAAVAVAAALTLNVLPAQAAGPVPDTQGAREMTKLSIESGSSASDAATATQAGWVMLWLALTGAGMGLINEALVAFKVFR
ncbi:hypothetical protein QVA66_09545 [Staphylococcus chromogenes]|nr:hypothetical protein [Staphylococcus chromogenes]